MEGWGKEEEGSEELNQTFGGSVPSPRAGSGTTEGSGAAGAKRGAKKRPDASQGTSLALPPPLRSGYVPAVMRSADTKRDLQVKNLSPGYSPSDDENDGVALRKRSEREFLKRVFRRIDTKGDGYIDEDEVGAYLARLGYEATPSEVQKLIWEVDDDGDGMISWKEFELTHVRLSTYDFHETRVAFEPRGFFNVIEFSVLDKDGNGTVDAAEVIAVFYRRYGNKGAMDKVGMLVDQGALDTTISFVDFIQRDNALRKKVRDRVAYNSGILDPKQKRGGRQERRIDPPGRSFHTTRPV